MPVNIDDLPEITRIDLNRLHEEWQEQPEIYGDWADALAYASKEMLELEGNIEVVDAEVDKEIREHPSAFGLADKVTEVAIKTKIALSKKHRRAVQDHINAKHLVDLLKAGINKLGQRKTALENVVDLRLANYFAEPVARSTKGKEAVREAAKRRARKAEQDG